MLQPYAIAVPVKQFKYREIVMRHADDTLHGFLAKKQGSSNFLFIVEHAVRQVRHHCMLMSALNVVHADMSLRNIVVFYNYIGDDFPKVKLIDYGFGCRFNEEEEEAEDKDVIRHYLKTHADESKTPLYKSYVKTFSDQFYRRPFKKDYEYDWIFFLYHLFIAFPILHPAKGICTFFPSNTIDSLQYYLETYYDDHWYDAPI